MEMTEREIQKRIDEGDTTAGAGDVAAGVGEVFRYVSE